MLWLVELPPSLPAPGLTLVPSCPSPFSTPGQASLSSPLAGLIPVSVPCSPFLRQKHPHFPFKCPNSTQMAGLKPTWPVTREPSLPSEIPRDTTTWTGHPTLLVLSGPRFSHLYSEKTRQDAPFVWDTLFYTPVRASRKGPAPD